MDVIVVSEKNIDGFSYLKDGNMIHNSWLITTTNEEEE